MRAGLLFLVLALVVGAGLWLLFRTEETDGAPGAGARAAMGRGVGLLEAFRYTEARDALREAVTLAPDWTDAKVNYAIALLNLQETDEALDVLRGILAAEPENTPARFLYGFLLVNNRGESEEGLGHLRRVAEPDAATFFWMGRALLDLKRLEEALRHYDEAIRLDRHLAAAYYGRFFCLTLLGREEEAQQTKAQWEEIRTDERANLLTAKAYHEIGRYALAIRRYPGPAPASPAPLFDEVPESGLGEYALGEGRPGVAIGDVDGDGDFDLYLPGALYENLGDLRFRQRGELPRHPGLFFDYDGDQVLDVFLYGEADRLLRGRGDGTWEDVTAAAGLADAAHRAWFALAADLDVDGDVDLFVTDDGGPNRFLRNNRDGTFTTIPLGKPAPSRGALVVDFDGDLDPDLVVAGAEGPPRLFRNDRADGFADAGPAPHPPGPALVAADLDRNGHEEVRTVTHPVLFEDFDLDGVLDEVAFPAARSAAAADLDGDGTPEIVVLDGDGRASLRKVRGAAGHWIAFDLRGRKAPAPPQWAAPVGPGAVVEILAGGTWQLRVSRSVSGFGAQHSPWVHFGLGPATQVDVVRILWPDRVLQAELDIPAGRVKVIREANRKPSSCPLLFTDGPGGPRFVTDFLGSGGLGFFLERGLYGKPDPDEVVFLGALEPLDGHYVLRVLEPLEEVSYLDEATLLAVDHPPGTEVLPNERFAGEEPFPEFRIWEFEERVEPVRAWNDRGEDVTPEIRAVDRRYPPFVLDGRFEGFARPHWLALDFSGRIPATGEGERLVLLLDGWVEYGYSHSNFAAAQAGLALEPPCLEIAEAGGWRTALPNTGYPAGLPRPMTLDVTGVLAPGREVFRLRTNLELYWDRVTLAVDRGRGRARVHRLPPATADLHERGYPREYSPDGGLPLLYDYGLMDPGYPFRTMAGDYTRFGEVAPLLVRSDDCFVIFGKGEELTLRYRAADLPELPPGWRRTFLLYTAGYCKDMDAYTAFPETVEPLPFRAMSAYPPPPGEAYPDDEEHRRYRAEWNTRRVHRR